MKQSSGTLLYRRIDDRLEVLLVHHSGGFNRRMPWSIPKGLPNKDEDLETAARRETLEETGVNAGQVPLVPLGSIDYKKSRKRVHCFAGPAPADALPCCASWEIDCAEFMAMDEARRRLHPDLHPFLDRLEEWLPSQQAGPDESHTC